MSKKQRRSSAFRCSSLLLLLVTLAVSINSCDRGGDAQIQAAERFADATARNNVPLRDSLIATRLFRSYFDNQFVANDMITWIQSIYDFHNHKFLKPARADVDKDFKADVQGNLIDTAQVEATGIVKVGSSRDDKPVAYFWMIKQHNRPWRVAMLTKGEEQVNFNGNPPMP